MVISLQINRSITFGAWFLDGRTSTCSSSVSLSHDANISPLSNVGTLRAIILSFHLFALEQMSKRMNHLAMLWVEKILSKLTCLACDTELKDILCYQCDKYANHLITNRPKRVKAHVQVITNYHVTYCYIMCAIIIALRYSYYKHMDNGCIM